MFVTMQCFNNLRGEEEKLPMTERFGLTMRRAGAAITITSLTDFLAFAVGGTTVRDKLKSLSNPAFKNFPTNPPSRTK